MYVQQHLSDKPNLRVVSTLTTESIQTERHHHCTGHSMAFRSPFQASKGGVPFPALSPFASSPAQHSDTGSPIPMDVSPVQSKFKTVPKRGTGLRSTTHGQGSPMDAAPYTPVSARQVNRAPAPESASKLPGRLSFTPHATRKSSPMGSANKQSPLQRKSRFSNINQSDPEAERAVQSRPPQLPSLYVAQGKHVHLETMSAAS